MGNVSELLSGLMDITSFVHGGGHSQYHAQHKHPGKQTGRNYEPNLLRLPYDDKIFRLDVANQRRARTKLRLYVN